MNEEWLEWTRHNLSRGCDVNEVRKILAKNGFSKSDIDSAMRSTAPKKLSFWQKLKQNFSKSEQNTRVDLRSLDFDERDPVDYVALSQPRITQNRQARRFNDERVQLYTLDNFLSDSECDAIIKGIDSNLRPSTVTSGEDSSRFRTSSTCDLGHMDSKSVDKIDKKIARTLGVRLSYSEVIQGQKYEVGQEFKAHTDYFEPHSKEYRDFATEMGQRTWTFMVYLSSTPQGGGTNFVDLDQCFYPKKGQAVIWNNLLPNGKPNPFTLHHGMPVEKGTKYIITKWFREKGKGQPLFPLDKSAK